jgi:hypothetical protein
VSRPAVEVADILHAQGDTFLEQHLWLSVHQRSVLRAIARCRTAVLGGHLDRCDACGHQAISYNSCRNRHCPKCQARKRRLHARERELLEVPYVHVVFTLPPRLLPLAYRNSTHLYTWLFHSSAATLREVAADPRDQRSTGIFRRLEPPYGGAVEGEPAGDSVGKDSAERIGRPEAWLRASTRRLGKPLRSAVSSTDPSNAVRLCGVHRSRIPSEQQHSRKLGSSRSLVTPATRDSS